MRLVVVGKRFFLAMTAILSMHGVFVVGWECVGRREGPVALRWSAPLSSGGLIEFELAIQAGRYDGRGSGWQTDGREEGLNGCRWGESSNDEDRRSLTYDLSRRDTR